MRSVPARCGATTALGQRRPFGGGVYVSIVRPSALANPVPRLPPRTGYGREGPQRSARKACEAGRAERRTVRVPLSQIDHAPLTLRQGGRAGRPARLGAMPVCDPRHPRRGELPPPDTALQALSLATHAKRRARIVCVVRPARPSQGRVGSCTAQKMLSIVGQNVIEGERKVQAQR
jgi:hypothetical protein